MQTYPIQTNKRNEMLDITSQVNTAIAQSGVQSGLAVIFVPHTTAAVTINENADPDVIHDILMTLEQDIPHQRPGYRHSEGNSDAHVKSSMFGASLTVIIEQGRALLGTWQGIYFCEFDGPRSRKFHLKIHAD